MTTLRFLLLASFVAVHAFVPPAMHAPTSSATIWYSNGDKSNDRQPSEAEAAIPTTISSPVLAQVYSELLEWKDEYGHSDIPLGSSSGRQCATLRRLHIQGKLLDAEVELLKSLEFRFHDLQDVYFHTEFDEMLSRLLAYETENKNQYQVPKKYAMDPELGAWVTGLRRLGPSQVSTEHAQQLDAVQFTWKSNKRCGSKFMQQYRALKEMAAESPQVLQSEETLQWIAAQRLARKRETLSDTRNHYMETLLGSDWMEMVE